MGKKKKRKEPPNPLEFLKARRLQGKLSGKRVHMHHISRPFPVRRDGTVMIEWVDLKAEYESLTQDKRVDIDVQLAADLWGYDPQDIVIKYPSRSKELTDPRKKKDE